MSSSQAILYRETVPAGKLVKALVVGIGVLFVALFILMLTTEEEDGAGLGTSALVLVLIALAYWNFRNLEITVTAEKFRAKYGLFSRRIPLANILSTEVTTGAFVHYGGVGIRLGLDGSWAYTTSFGPALRLRQNRGWPFVVSSAQPQALAQAIQMAKVKVGY